MLNDATCYVGCTTTQISMPTHGPLPAPVGPHGITPAFTGADIAEMVLFGVALIVAGCIALWALKVRKARV